MKPLFSFETDYDMNTFMAMARALRMTVRKKHSKRSLVFGLGVAALGVASIIANGALRRPVLRSKTAAMRS